MPQNATLGVSMRKHLLLTLAAATLLSASPLNQQFVGMWNMVSYEVHTPAGEIVYPLGRDAVGRLTYDAAGHASLQMMRRGQPKFHTEKPAEATNEELAAAWRGYIGYYGTWSVDAKAQTVTHTVEAAWYPNYMGTKQVRKFRFEGNRLTLEGTNSLGVAIVTFEKAGSSSAADGRR
jgi:hypothetical protein